MSASPNTTILFADGEEKSLGDVLQRMESSHRELIMMLNSIINNCIEVCDICSNKIRDIVDATSEI